MKKLVSGLLMVVFVSNSYSQKLVENKIDEFTKESIKRTYDENDMINFETLDEFNRKPRWSLIVDNIINNPDFYVCLTSSNRIFF